MPQAVTINQPVSSRPQTGFGPFNASSWSLKWQIAAVFVGSLALTISSYIQVPLWPVPVTMQTFAVAMVGALLGWRLGGITVLAWLAQAAAGLPVLAGGAGGLASFVGPTAGYLFAFPLAAAAAGWLAERGWGGRRPVRAFMAQMLSNAICLFFGALWLSALVGAQQAVAVGVMPFLLGALLKSLLGAVTLALLMQARKRTDK